MTAAWVGVGALGNHLPHTQFLLCAGSLGNYLLRIEAGHHGDIPRPCRGGNHSNVAASQSCLGGPLSTILRHGSVGEFKGRSSLKGGDGDPGHDPF